MRSPGNPPPPARYLEVREELLTRTAAALNHAARAPRRYPDRPAGRVYTSKALRRETRPISRRETIGHRLMGLVLLLAGATVAAAVVLVVLAVALAVPR